jgi:DNA-binding transcriptional ArsR family regulator
LLAGYFSIAQVDSTGLNAVFGKKGTVQGMVYRITYPRSDLKGGLERLRNAGLVTSRRVGRRILYRLAGAETNTPVPASALAAVELRVVKGSAAGAEAPRDRAPALRYEGALVHPPEPHLWG